VVARLALLSVLTAAAPAKLAVSLLDLGSYRKPELPAAAANRDWLALCRTDAGAELKAVQIEVRELPGGKGQPAREVAAPDCPYAVALLRSPALRPGKLETVPDDQGAFTFKDTRYVVRRDAPEPEPDARCGVRRVHLVLTAGERRQILAGSDFCTVYTLRWIGDLDADGKLDLLVAENLDSGATILRLFLSAKAAPGAVVGAAGVVRHGG
jgi:hypothetical protein